MQGRQKELDSQPFQRNGYMPHMAEDSDSNINDNDGG